MYTGIVQGAYPVVNVEKKVGLNSVTVALPSEMMADLSIGASVGLDGVCLTVTTFTNSEVSFDIMHETLSLTTLSTLSVGDRVNVERSAKQGVEVGGHYISGHVDGVVKVVDIQESENNYMVSYELPPVLVPYVFKKGFVGLNGCSLTVADIDKASRRFRVCFIPETLRVTTHGKKKVGDLVNIEIDRQTQVIVDTVRDFMQENIMSPSLPLDREPHQSDNT